MDSFAQSQISNNTPVTKRKRSLSKDVSPNAASISKAARHHVTSQPSSHGSSTSNPFQQQEIPLNRSTQLQINYLVRAYHEDLTLISPEDSLASNLDSLHAYFGVLDRNESLASNLGARSRSSEIIQRVSRIFDDPPRVIYDQQADRETFNHVPVTWLDVLDFARTNPDEFMLKDFPDGTRLCEFQLRNCRVQISEGDWHLVNSGLAQKIMPSQPLAEDEEKELGTLEILEEHVFQISRMADSVAAKARQFNHKLKARKQAIIERRAADISVSGSNALRPPSPSNVALMNGTVDGQQPAVQSPHAGFQALNTRQGSESNTAATWGSASAHNGTTVSQSTHDELLRTFTAISNKHNRVVKHRNQHSRSPVKTPARSTNLYDATNALYHAVPIPPTPAPLHHRTSRAIDPAEGIFKAIMVAQLDSLAKGDHINPPCDRCRRLRFPCAKNLTACIGCTKKHAKCSWRDVTEEEAEPLISGSRPFDNPGPDRALYAPAIASMVDAEARADQESQRAAHNLALAAMQGAVNAEGSGETKVEVQFN